MEMFFMVILPVTVLMYIWDSRRGCFGWVQTEFLDNPRPEKMRGRHFVDHRKDTENSQGEMVPSDENKLLHRVG